MPISFDSVPTNIRVPFMYAEFNNANAVQGPDQQPYKVLIMGQMLAAGTATALVPVRITSAAQAQTLFGEGSHLHGMALAHFANNTMTETWVIPVADASGTQATGSIAITGPATASGTLALYIAGRRIAIGVTSGDSATTIGDAIAAAINGATGAEALPCTAVNTTGTVAITARHDGTIGNEINIRHSHLSDESLPAGVGVTITAMASGATDPTLTSAIAAMGDEWYNCVAFGWTNSAALTAIKAEMADRFGPLRMIDGRFFVSKNDTHGNLGTFGDAHNSQHMIVMHSRLSPMPAYEWAAALCAVDSYYAPIDQARPLQTLEIKAPAGVYLAPKKADLFTFEENNLLLYDGVGTFYVDADGSVRIQRVVTTYKTSALGAPDVSYLDIETLQTLSYLRYDFRNFFTRKYPRHKLADDGTRYGRGQAVMTPKLAKAEAINRFRQWEELGLVENIDQFKEDIIVERNAVDRNRLDFMLPPDLVNQLRVVGVQIGFIL